MKVSVVTAPGETQVSTCRSQTVGPPMSWSGSGPAESADPTRLYIAIGGIPPRQGTPRWATSRPARSSRSAATVTGIAVGDHVVVNPMAAPSGIIGNGGATGALADYLLIENAVRGTSLEVVPDHIPFEVAALNEPMAVARHGVNRCQPKPSDKVVVFGAGPIGLGATIAFKSLGVSHVVVADLIPARLEKALQVGADAVINSADEDVAAAADRTARRRRVDVPRQGGHRHLSSTPPERPR